MHLFIIPLIMMVVSQAIKLVRAALKREFSWNILNTYGGMPSSHAALASSLATVMAYDQGFQSPAFAMSLILLVVILRDATGFRFQLGVHADVLNSLVKELPDREEYRYPFLKNRLGHTPAEVAAGLILGIVGSIALIAITPYLQAVL